MKNKDFLRGIYIISGKMPDSERLEYGVRAEHDQIWFGSSEWNTDPLDVKTLEDLGWFIDEDSWSCYA